jgi:signal peptidase I
MEVDITEPGSPDAVSIPASTPARPLAKRSSIAEYGESLLVTVLLALFGTTFIVQAFKIPSQSMEPTLLIGDHLLVNKFIFGGQGAWYEKILPYRAIRRGDIIVFKFPFDDHPHYVKRVVGLPGDRVRIINQHVYVNDDLLNEPYVVHDAAYQDPFGDNFPPAGRYFAEIGIRPEWAEQILSHVHHGELVVPPDNYFVMGDNRDRSWDSRYWGFVDRSAVMGRPVMIYWSVEATPLDYARRNFLGTLRAAGQNLLHLPARTRWQRMMHEVH